MSVIIILLTVSICIAGAFLAAFLWSVRDGQFDDDKSPAQRLLFDSKKQDKTENNQPTLNQYQNN